MRVMILGSAAAEGWPALFCECEVCAEARRRGGPNQRRRTAYWINRDTLVDFGPDIHWQTAQFGIDLAAVGHIFLTHSHTDHFSPVELRWRARGFSAVTRSLTLYANARALDRLRDERARFGGDMSLTEELMTPGRCVTASRLRMTALLADHADPGEQPLNYVIEEDGRSLLIANDTGWWPDESWAAIRAFRLDAAILECTYLHSQPEARSKHLGFAATVAMRDRLSEIGVLRPGAAVVANHFSHNGRTLHEELCDAFRPHGIAVGHDGMVFEL